MLSLSCSSACRSAPSSRHPASRRFSGAKRVLGPLCCCSTFEPGCDRGLLFGRFSAAPVSGGKALHTIAIPDAASLFGLVAHTQGLVFAPGAVTLTNGLELVLR